MCIFYIERELERGASFCVSGDCGFDLGEVLKITFKG